MNSKTSVTLKQTDFFSTLLGRRDLEWGLNGFKAMPEYDAALRYDEGGRGFSNSRPRAFRDQGTRYPLTPVKIICAANAQTNSPINRLTICKPWSPRSRSMRFDK